MKATKKPLKIKALNDPDPWTHGSYELYTGVIELGTTEENTIPILWHEQMHKILYEDINHKSACFKFDNISTELEWFFFGRSVEIMSKNYKHRRKNKNNGGIKCT